MRVFGERGNRVKDVVVAADATSVVVDGLTNGEQYTFTVAAINSVGNLGGFIAQNAVPWIDDTTGSKLAPMWFLAACMVAGALMTFVVQAALRRHRPPASPTGRMRPAE